MQDTVSVIIPAYNAAGFIERAIDSALGQTHKPLEILVVDDGSQDRTAAIVARQPPPVRLIRKPNGGPASARNLGAQQAQGDWLALLDADDWWFPDKLRAQLACVTGDRIGLVHALPDHRKEAVPPRLGFADLWARNWIIASSALIRRSAFQAMGGFDEAPALVSVEDYHLWLRLAASGWTIVTCPLVLVHYTRGAGISSDFDRFLAASLANVADLGLRLSLPDASVRWKRSRVHYEFGCLALYERRMTQARRLLFRACADAPSPLHAASLVVSAVPRPLLDLRRHGLRLAGSRMQAETRSHGRLRDDGQGEPASDDEPDSAARPAGLRCEADRPPAPGPKVFAGTPIPILRQNAGVLPAEARMPQPVLITTVDAEEDFDWKQPFSRAATDVTSMGSQHRAHRVFERHGVVPVYLADYPVASQDAGRGPLRELLQGGLCEIGAQLHAWVTPPFAETVSPRNSFPGNLPAALEFAKVRALTDALETAFGAPPRIFRAGRYGVGPHTGAILAGLGYEADTSVVPWYTFAADGGPDFRSSTAHPYWLDRPGGLLELPVSAALVGRASQLPSRLTRHLFSAGLERVHAPSVMARLGLVERIKLTPEGIALAEAQLLVRHMVRHGHRVFVLTYHSPSLEPGNTPYVRTEDDVRRLLDWLDAFYTFFRADIGGRFARWGEVREALADGDAPAVVLPSSGRKS